MKIITSHINTDLDALASMVAARKLYPSAVIVLPGKSSRNVERFMSLYKDTINAKSLRYIDYEKVDMVILVDTKSTGRLAELGELLRKPGIPVHIYDHHPPSDDDVRGVIEVVESVGAATTLIVEKIREKGLQITATEATIFALGIYEDTGSLVFTSTTARDAEAVAYLLDNGANLAVVADFLSGPLTDDQRLLLKKLMLSAEQHQINGIKVLIAKGNADEFIDGLSLLTHKLADYAHLDAVFTVVEMEDRVHVVARSSIPEINVKEIMNEFSGGGHPAAASATIKDSGVNEVAGRLLEALKLRARPQVLVSDIMSSPVKTIEPGTIVEDAGKVMMRYGHTGLPIVKDRNVVGIISRRDVEKALHHGLGHAPAKGFMTTNLITVTPEQPVSSVRDLMIEHDVGRLPVLQEGSLVGIVSRSDVLRTLHSQIHRDIKKTVKFRRHGITGNNIKELMFEGLSNEYLNIMYKSGEMAHELGHKVYGAGGIVRDLLLGVECYDIDLVVEGEAINLAERLGQYYDARVRSHPKFRTATLFFPKGQQVDIATARVEFYQYPAAMPQVEASSLHQDLYRRDFTINAMAVSLNKEDCGEIVDYFGGREDLVRNQIRVLHNLSFVEDPTRLLRGVRFEKRFNMSLEPQTLKLAREAIKNKMLERVSTERIWEELKVILMEPRPGPALARLSELKIWDFLFPGVVYSDVSSTLSELPRLINMLRSWNLGFHGENWLIYYIAILHQSDQTLAEQLCFRYNLGKRRTEKLIAALKGWRDIVKGIRCPEAFSTSNLVKKLMFVPREAYPLILFHLYGYEARQKLRDLISSIYYDKPSIGGKDLSAMGYQPGPIYKKALDAVWQARLDGLVHTRQEELEYVKKYLDKKAEEY